MHMENYEYGEFPVTLKMTSKLLQPITLTLVSPKYEKRISRLKHEQHISRFKNEKHIARLIHGKHMAQFISLSGWI